MPHQLFLPLMEWRVASFEAPTAGSLRVRVLWCRSNMRGMRCTEIDSASVYLLPLT